MRIVPNGFGSVATLTSNFRLYLSNLNNDVALIKDTSAAVIHIVRKTV